MEDGREIIFNGQNELDRAISALNVIASFYCEVADRDNTGALNHINPDQMATLLDILTEKFRAASSSISVGIHALSTKAAAL